MTNSTQHQSRHTCPHCKSNQVDTIAKAPYVRGFLLAYQLGSKTFIGCTSCVKKKLFGEVGLSMLLGWLSITALIINPFLILWNLIQGLTIGPKQREVESKLRDLGIPSNPNAINLTQIGYSLAASMIKADGKVEASEVQTASLIGKQIFQDFDENRFQSILNSPNLPSTQSLTLLLKDVLDQNGKEKIYQYLVAVAQADGHVDKAEQRMLAEVANGMGLSLKPQARRA